MSVYSVHIRDTGIKPRLVVIKEGFSWGAAVFGFLWAPFVGAWALAGLFLLIEIATELWMNAALDTLAQQAVVHLGQGAVFGLAANELRRMFLARRGVVETDVVRASGREAAERRYLEEHPEFAAKLLSANV